MKCGGPLIFQQRIQRANKLLVPSNLVTHKSKYIKRRTGVLPDLEIGFKTILVVNQFLVSDLIAGITNNLTYV